MIQFTWNCDDDELSLKPIVRLSEPHLKTSASANSGGGKLCLPKSNGNIYPFIYLTGRELDRKRDDLPESPISRSLNVYSVVPVFIMGTCNIRALCQVLYTPNSAAAIDDTDFARADGL